MKTLRILYKGINAEQLIIVDDNAMADVLFNDIFNARVKHKDVMLIQGIKSRRFISPQEIADCTIETTGE